MNVAENVRLILLFGGQSAEHEVSCTSARHVLAAADPDKYAIDVVGIAKDGAWVRAEGAMRALEGAALELPTQLEAAGPGVDALPVLAAAPEEQVVVFPVLHGPMGEDGTIQGLLEVAGVPYVGAGVLASALCMDKIKAKEMFDAHGIPQARWEAVSADDVTDADLDELAERLGYPMFVKPANLGSSVGVSRVQSDDELRAAVALAGSYDEWIVAEEGINGREIECAVLGNQNPDASLPGEIIPGAEFYDYDDKYVDGAAELRIPAELPEGVTEELRALAITAYQALRCEGLARVDFFYEEDGRGLLVNEINTMPGFTPISMYPKMWEATGVSYPELIDRLVELALDRHARRARHRRLTH